MAVLLGVLAAGYFAFVALAAPPLAAPSITVSPPNPSASTSAIFSFTGPSGATFECRLDSAAAFATCASPKTYTSLAVGSHMFRVRSKKTTQTSSETTYSWSVVAPATPMITSKPANPTNQTTASFSFTTNASNATFLCKLDAAAFAACTSPKRYLGLAAGSYTFQVEAVGAAGSSTGTSSPASYTWLIDLTPPAAPSITSGPTGPTASTSASFTVTGELGATFKCALDSTASPVACTSPTAYSGLAQGAHTFYVRQTDTAGNTSLTWASRSWTVDTVAPPKPSLSGPTSPTSSTSATFTFGDAEAGVVFRCSLDEGPFTSPCVSPKTYTGLAVGTHELKVVAVDAVGNVSNAAEWYWTITVPQGQPYTIGAVISGSLAPGGSALPIDLTFNSLNSGNGGSGANGTQVAALTVAISSITDQGGHEISELTTGAGVGTGACKTSNYQVVPFSGAYPFYIPLGVSDFNGSNSSQSLRYTNTAQWPSIRMLDSGNQDGCKDATVHLTLGGHS